MFMESCIQIFKLLQRSDFLLKEPDVFITRIHNNQSYLILILNSKEPFTLLLQILLQYLLLYIEKLTEIKSMCDCTLIYGSL